MHTRCAELQQECVLFIVGHFLPSDPRTALSSSSSFISAGTGSYLQAVREGHAPAAHRLLVFERKAAYCRYVFLFCFLNQIDEKTKRKEIGDSNDTLRTCFILQQSREETTNEKHSVGLFKPLQIT